MRIRTASDAVYTLIAWAPLFAIAIGVFWVLAFGLLEFEAITLGTEFMIGNDQTTNVLPTPGGVSNEQLLLDALNSGDTAQMTQALEAVEQRQAAAAAAR